MRRSSRSTWGSSPRWIVPSEALEPRSSPRWREWTVLNACLSHVRREVKKQPQHRQEEPPTESHVFVDPFTQKTTVYTRKDGRLFRNGCLWSFGEREGTIHAMTHTACLVTGPNGSVICTSDHVFPFPKYVSEVRYLYNIHKCVIICSTGSFVILGPEDYPHVDDWMWFSPSRPCVCFTESHQFALYESGRCIVLAETQKPYRIHAVTRIDEFARNIYYDPMNYEIVINGEIVLSMF